MKRSGEPQNFFAHEIFEVIALGYGRYKLNIVVEISVLKENCEKLFRML